MRSYSSAREAVLEPPSFGHRGRVAGGMPINARGPPTRARRSPASRCAAHRSGRASARPHRPSSRSQACSGCGIRPNTLRCALTMPAMLLSEPFGLAAGGGAAGSHRRSAARPGGSSSSRSQRRRRRPRSSPSPCLIGRSRTSPRAQRAVNGVSVSSTRTCTVLAHEAQAAVADQRARQQTRLAQDLEAVADAEHQSAGARRSATTRSMTGEKRAIAPQRR